MQVDIAVDPSLKADVLSVWYLHYVNGNTACQASPTPKPSPKKEEEKKSV